jgi:hypothetical protein
MKTNLLLCEAVKVPPRGRSPIFFQMNGGKDNFIKKGKAIPVPGHGGP